MIFWSEGLFGSFRLCLSQNTVPCPWFKRAPTAPDATPRGSVCGWMTARPAEEWLYLKGIHRALRQLHFDLTPLFGYLNWGINGFFFYHFQFVAIHLYRLIFFQCNSFVWEEGKNHQVKRTLVVRSLRRKVNRFQSHLQHFFYRGRDVIGTGRLHCTMVDVLAP